MKLVERGPSVEERSGLDGEGPLLMPHIRRELRVAQRIAEWKCGRMEGWQDSRMAEWKRLRWMALFGFHTFVMRPH